jgi:hypothetical protein
MPMSFPNFESLKRAAKVHGFRQPTEGENETMYRYELANHVTPRDRIEGHEIRTGKGWNDWNDIEKMELFKFYLT